MVCLAMHKDKVSPKRPVGLGYSVHIIAVIDALNSADYACT